jgi:hypothetical protein
MYIKKLCKEYSIYEDNNITLLLEVSLAMIAQSV